MKRERKKQRPKNRTTSRATLTGVEQEWIKTRRRLLAHVKRQVSDRLGVSNAEVVKFTRTYERELRQPWQASSQAELQLRIEQSDLVYGGDFHALAQAQRTHLRFLRRLKTKRKVTLALEAFQAKAQIHLDRYLERKTDLAELREKSRWSEAWGFPWEHYRPLLELARSRGFSLLALNSRPGSLKSADLERREKRAAKLIAQSLNDKPGSLMYVIFGDLHLAKTHLPRAVKNANHRKLRELTIHLNSEKVYFDLALQRRELSVDVVKYSETTFCVLSTPPWVKWQSYLLFLERGPSVEAAARGARLDEEADFDATDQVAMLVRLAAADLKLKSDMTRVSDLSVYGEDDEIIWRKVSKLADLKERKHAEALLKSGQSFFIAKGGLAYLPNPTINSAASLAGLYLHCKLSRRHRSLIQFPGDFRASVWIEAVSYFISKLVNHNRRSETLSGLQTKLQIKSPLRERNVEALRLALDLRLSEIVRATTGRERKPSFHPRRKSSYVEASRILGGMLGERLYLSYRSRKLKREQLVSWMKKDPAAKDFGQFYDVIVQQIAAAT